MLAWYPGRDSHDSVWVWFFAPFPFFFLCSISATANGTYKTSQPQYYRTYLVKYMLEHVLNFRVSLRYPSPSTQLVLFKISLKCTPMGSQCVSGEYTLKPINFSHKMSWTSPMFWRTITATKEQIVKPRLPDLWMITPQIYRSLRNRYQNVFLIHGELTLRWKFPLS